MIGERRDRAAGLARENFFEIASLAADEEERLGLADEEIDFGSGGFGIGRAFAFASDGAGELLKLRLRELVGGEFDVANFVGL